MDQELYNLSFKDFKLLFNDQAKKLLRGKRNQHRVRNALGLLWSKDKFLQMEHAKLILTAIESNVEINREVLKEYKEYKLTALAIKKYCKKRKIALTW